MKFNNLIKMKNKIIKWIGQNVIEIPQNLVIIIHLIIIINNIKKKTQHLKRQNKIENLYFDLLKEKILTFWNLFCLFIFFVKLF